MSCTDYLLVCAIDFGTTFTGYAFSFPATQMDIKMYKDWGSCMGLQLAHRTPTCCLTTRNGKEPLAFGYEAQHKYMSMEPEEAKEHSFYEKFKMNLYTKKEQKQIYIADKFGENTSLTHLFAIGLRYLSSHMIEHVKTQTDDELPMESVRWVITVPAIWSDASKQFMRKAAKEAGIINEVDSHNLVIALEPEAASLYCRQLQVNHSGYVKLPEGTKYLVMDCGGGTLDVTVHHLGEVGVTELYQATGSDLGGTKVDDNFVKLLCDVFGDDVIDYYKDVSPADYLNLLTNFQQAKKTVKPTKKETTNIGFSSEFSEMYRELKNKSLKDAIRDEWTEKGMKVTGGQWRIPIATMLGLFEPVVQGIVNHMKDLMSVPAVKDVTHLLLVGGFAESAVLQHAIRKEFGPKISVIVPDEASLCVMKGATLFGHNSSSSIVKRRAKETYGTDIYPPFDAAKHDPTKTKMYGDTRRADGVFRVLANKGEFCESKKSTHRPILPDQSNIVIGLYRSSLSEPLYCSDPEVEIMGNVIVPLTGTGLDRKVEAEFTLGGTEIIVNAKDCGPDGKTVKATINYLEN